MSRSAFGVLWCLVALWPCLPVDGWAGIVQGRVLGVPAGTVLPVFSNRAPAGKITVGANGQFSIFLAPGSYAVRCPSNRMATVQALSGPVTQDINC